MIVRAMRMSPWVGVVLIALGGVMFASFWVLKIPEGTLASVVVLTGVAVIQTAAHAQTQSALTVLRRSMRPPSSHEVNEQLVSLPPDPPTGSHQIPPPK